MLQDLCAKNFLGQKALLVDVEGEGRVGRGGEEVEVALVRWVYYDHSMSGGSCGTTC